MKVRDREDDRDKKEREIEIESDERRIEGKKGKTQIDRMVENRE